MSHLLDTNTCIDHLRKGPASKVASKLAAAPSGSVVLCSVVVAELLSAWVQMPGHATDPMPPATPAGHHPAANTSPGYLSIAQSNEFSE